MFSAFGKIKKIEVSAKIVRADGSVEDLGIIARKESFLEFIKRKLGGN